MLESTLVNKQSSRLENINVSFLDLLVIFRIVLGWHCKSPVLVYGCKIVRNTIVEPRIHDQHHTYTRRLAKKAFFRKRIRL